MTDAADLSPVPAEKQTQSAFDLFLIFAAANVVATTMQTGAVLGLRFGGGQAIVNSDGRRTERVELDQRPAQLGRAEE